MFRLNLSLTLIVPALRVGMALWTLRFRDGMTREGPGLRHYAERGNDQSRISTCESELARE